MSDPSTGNGAAIPPSAYPQYQEQRQRMRRWMWWLCMLALLFFGLSIFLFFAARDANEQAFYVPIPLLACALLAFGALHFRFQVFKCPVCRKYLPGSYDPPWSCAACSINLHPPDFDKPAMNADEIISCFQGSRRIYLGFRKAQMISGITAITVLFLGFFIASFVRIYFSAAVWISALVCYLATGFYAQHICRCPNCKQRLRAGNLSAVDALSFLDPDRCPNCKIPLKDDDSTTR